MNYDLPLQVTAIRHDEESKTVYQFRCAIQWYSIEYIEEYSNELDNIIEWKEYKGKDRTWITHNDYTNVVLIDYEEIMEAWKFYLKNVKFVSDYQIPHCMREDKQIPPNI